MADQIATRPAPRADVIERPFIGRYYRSCHPEQRYGYDTEVAAQQALNEILAILKPGELVAYKGEARQFVGFTKTSRDIYYGVHIPKLLLRSPFGDIWVSVYDLDEQPPDDD